MTEELSKILNYDLPAGTTDVFLPPNLWEELNKERDKLGFLSLDEVPPDYPILSPSKICYWLLCHLSPDKFYVKTRESKPTHRQRMYIVSLDDMRLVEMAFPPSLQVDQVDESKIMEPFSELEPRFRDRLMALRNLPMNWDNFAGEPLSHKVIKRVEEFLLQIGEPRRRELDEEDIIPNPNGTVSVAYKNGSKAIEIEFGEPGVSYFIRAARLEKNSLSFPVAPSPERPADMFVLFFDQIQPK